MNPAAARLAIGFVAFAASLLWQRLTVERLVRRWRADDRSRWVTTYSSARRVQPFRALIASRITDAYARLWLSATPEWARRDPEAKRLLKNYRFATGCILISLLLVLLSILT